MRRGMKLASALAVLLTVAALPLAAGATWD
jgi:hypothetical protein